MRIRSSISNSIVVLASLAAATQLCAQTIEPRTDFGALLEPQGVIMHGAGQSPDDFNDYWQAMPDGRKPVVYMAYISLSSLGPDWSNELKDELMRYDGQFLIPQIGLSMTSDGSPEGHYEDQVAAGAFDAQIDNLVEGFRRLASPAYIRIGYEFNGLDWNGYLPESYRAAYIRITEKLREANLEVATVWCGAMDGVRNFFDYYPGDEYVDWFGLDLFSAGHFTEADAFRFLDSAAVRGKPVMIGETTPRFVGVSDGQADWDEWFVPFFDYMRTRPEIKQFGYINWDWVFWSAQTGIDWNDWGDARLQTNPVVLANYTDAIGLAEFMHATDEVTFRKMLGYDDDTPPPAVANLQSVGDSTTIVLSWDPVDDPSGLARYNVYRGGQVVGRTLTPTFTETDPMFGVSEYIVTAMDRAGNESTDSEVLAVERMALERIRNGGFEDRQDAWRFELFDGNAAAELSFETGDPIAGSNSAVVDIQTSTGTNWHIQLRQIIPIVAGNTYRISLQVRASEAVGFPLMIQQFASPFTIYEQFQVNAGPGAETFTFTFTPNVDEEVALSLYLGDVGQSTVTVDEVSVVEELRSSVSNESEISLPDLEVSVYPLPASQASTIELTTPTAGGVKVEAFDALGRRVRVVSEGWLAAGRHRLNGVLDGLTPGYYVLRLTRADGGVKTTGVPVLR